MNYVKGFVFVSSLLLSTPSQNGELPTRRKWDYEVKTPVVRAPYQAFKAKMAELESGGFSHTVVNQFGYMGKYQFGKTTLRELARRGYMEPVDFTEFLSNVELQEKAMDALIKANIEYIYKSNLNDYTGKLIKGTRITMNGMLAASHLVGPYAVKRFLKTDGRVNRKDGNGTSVVDYLREFENELEE